MLDKKEKITCLPIIEVFILKASKIIRSYLFESYIVIILWIKVKKVRFLLEEKKNFYEKILSHKQKH